MQIVITISNDENATFTNGLHMFTSEKDIVIPYLKTLAESTAKTAAIAKRIQRDLRAIREGNTGASSLRGIDPLSPSKREEVNRVKALIRERRKTNPNYPLLSVSAFVLKESARIGRIGGYDNTTALNSRASTELKREEKGLKPF